MSLLPAGDYTLSSCDTRQPLTETRGFFGQGDMQKEFEEASFALKPGEISPVIETASGLHLIERYVSATRATRKAVCFFLVAFAFRSLLSAGLRGTCRCPRCYKDRYADTSLCLSAGSSDRKETRISACRARQRLAALRLTSHLTRLRHHIGDGSLQRLSLDLQRDFHLSRRKLLNRKKAQC